MELCYTTSITLINLDGTVLGNSNYRARTRPFIQDKFQAHDLFVFKQKLGFNFTSVLKQHVLAGKFIDRK